MQNSEPNFEYGTEFKVKLGLKGYKIPIDDIERHFNILEDIVKRHSETMAFTQECENILTTLDGTIQVYFTGDQLERHINDINKQFGQKQILAFRCHEIAAQILIFNQYYPKPLRLSGFKNIVLWVKYKIIFRYLSRTTNYTIPNLSNQFNRMLLAVRECNKSVQHTFPSDHSSAYHTNAHFDELNVFHLEESPFLGNAEMLQKLQSMNCRTDNIINNNTTLKADIDILNIDDNILNDCMSFYLHQVPDFLFDESIYTQDSEGFGYTREIEIGGITYFAQRRIKGCKRYFDDTIFVATIHVIKARN